MLKTYCSILIFCLLGLNACTNMNNENTNPSPFTPFERKVASKMALDIRYFCTNNINEQTTQCLKPVTELPLLLADMITETELGSVVLFAENLIDIQQIVKLTKDLQSAASKSKSAQPLIISIDQEGGRVVRFPSATSFAGNMAIGATYSQNGVKFATETSKVIAKELIALGINNNYAPVIDVNTNAKNPVINTRSFGKDPKRVAELGVAAVNGFQQQGIMATLKHFPGHGDTHIDSHLGLPLVAHNFATIEKQDIAPFKWAIKHSDPAMIMTAHIQYPALDNSTIENISGEIIIRPATMSRKILTDLLRKKMGFDGIIATDALDMAGIAHYFDEVTAVVETFSSGADLAVMPFKIRKPRDVIRFKLFVKSVAKELAKKIEGNDLLADEINQSVIRLTRYKDKYIKIADSLGKGTALSTKDLYDSIIKAKQVVANSEHLEIEQQLADNAVTLLTNTNMQIPLRAATVEHIHLLVANKEEQLAMYNAIKQAWRKAKQSKLRITTIIAGETEAFAKVQNMTQLQEADLVIATLDIKMASAVDTGGVEDLLKRAINGKKYNKAALSDDQVNYVQLLKLQLSLAKKYNIPNLLIAKGSPYLLGEFSELANSVLITYEDRIYKNEDKQWNSPGYNTSMDIVIGVQKALGELPVTLP